MPSKARGKGKTKATRRPRSSAKPARQPTEFGELDTTPTSRHSQQTFRSESLGALRSAEVSDGLDPGGGSPDHCDSRAETPFAWSQTTSVRGRSSPIEQGETPIGWEFDALRSQTTSVRGRSSSIGQGDTPAGNWNFDCPSPDTPTGLPEPFSSQVEGHNELPATLPITQPQQLEDIDHEPSIPRVDFSETATSAVRSSSVGTFTLADNIDAIWDFAMEDIEAPPFEFSVVTRSNDQLPPEDIQMDDATQLRNGQTSAKTTKPQATRHGETKQVTDLPDEGLEKPVKPRTGRKALASVHSTRGTNSRKNPSHAATPSPFGTNEHFSGLSTGPEEKSKKRKQRAKTPLAFDSDTLEIVPPESKRPKLGPARLPLSNRLQDGFEESRDPPDATKRVTKKPPAKNKKKPSPKSKATTNSRAARRREQPPKRAKKGNPKNSPGDQISDESFQDDQPSVTKLARKPPAKRVAKKDARQDEEQAEEQGAIQIDDDLIDLLDEECFELAVEQNPEKSAMQHGEQTQIKGQKRLVRQAAKQAAKRIDEQIDEESNEASEDESEKRLDDLHVPQSTEQPENRVPEKPGKSSGTATDAQLVTKAGQRFEEQTVHTREAEDVQETELGLPHVKSPSRIPKQYPAKHTGIPKQVEGDARPHSMISLEKNLSLPLSPRLALPLVGVPQMQPCAPAAEVSIEPQIRAYSSVQAENERDESLRKGMIAVPDHRGLYDSAIALRSGARHPSAQEEQSPTLSKRTFKQISVSEMGSPLSTQPGVPVAQRSIEGVQHLQSRSKQPKPSSKPINGEATATFASGQPEKRVARQLQFDVEKDKDYIDRPTRARPESPNPAQTRPVSQEFHQRLLAMLNPDVGSDAQQKTADGRTDRIRSRRPGSASMSQISHQLDCVFEVS